MVTPQGKSQVGDPPEKHQKAVPAKKKKHDYLKTERYKVRPEIVEKIVKNLGVEPTLDAFADEETNVFPVWWGPGSKNLMLLRCLVAQKKW